MNKKEVFSFEKQKLEEVIASINKRIETVRDNFSKQEKSIVTFDGGLRGDQFTKQALMSLYATEIIDLENVLASPYFGKLDFKSIEKDKVESIYIGKKVITDDEDNIISHDWRSPICSMYYDYCIGDAQYSLNGEVIKGEILNKRQLVIKNGKLESVEEQDTLTNDSILLKYLNENADSRLKSIIATIQKEQNLIIRSPLKKDYIIQGVAGSGKTTVALHRIAYLLYNEAKNINEADFLVLGPNKYFLNYISELLPDLDINNVSQSTFEEIALNNIKGNVKLEDKNITLENVLSNKADKNIIEYKNSIEFLQLLEKYITAYVVGHLQKPIICNDVIICPPEKMERIYDKVANLINRSYAERIKMFSKDLIKEIKSNSDNISHNFWLQYKRDYGMFPADHPQRVEAQKKLNELRKEIEKGCATEIKDYFKFIKINPLMIYQTFIENLDCFADEIPVDVEKLKEYTLEKLSKKQIRSEDLAPILHINSLINGSKSKETYSHLVIDEAQDLSLSQYYVLKKLFPNCYFDIFGDVNQSIYDYQSTHDWNVLNEKIFDSKANILNLNKSYRTTLQISDASNLILDDLGYDKADCISREGRDINVMEINSKSDEGNIINQISELLDNNCQTIAVICKDDNETDQVYKKLSKHGLNINKISSKNEKYDGGICVLPSYLSKGLEFDAVILHNASNEVYTDSEIDMKLLYVSITRAMHELRINYDGELAAPLQKLIKKAQKKRVLK